MPRPDQSEVLGKRLLERQLSFSQSKLLCAADIRSPKIEEILQTGQLRRIGYERTDDVEVCRLFQGIYGVGTIIHLSNFVPK